MKKWKLKGTEKLHDSKYMSVFNDRVVLPNGQEITYSRVELNVRARTQTLLLVQFHTQARKDKIDLMRTRTFQKGAFLV